MVMMNKYSNGNQERYEIRFNAGEQLRHYKLVVRADGSFAAKCLETDRYVAGYDIADPDLSIDEAAQRIYSIRYGEFYTLFLRCTRIHLEEQIRREYERVRRMLPREDTGLLSDFPTDAIRSSAL